MCATPNTYRAEGLWTIDQVDDYRKHNAWPIPTSSGDLSCYSSPVPRECSDCVFVNLEGIAYSGTLIDPNGSLPSSGLSLPRNAWLVENDYWHWYDWWWYGNYNWNWRWRYPWYSRWYGGGWYWGWYCSRYWFWMNPVTLFNVTCSDITDQYPTCGSGSFSVSNFSWGDTFNGTSSLSFTPTSSGLLVNKNNTLDSWTATNIGSDGQTSSTWTYNRHIYSNSSGLIPWTANYNYYSNAYFISKGIPLYDEFYSQTFDGIVNTGNVNGTNALNVIYSTGTSITSNGYNSYYYGSLPDNDPIWTRLSWKAGYPAALTGNGSFWFAITYKTVSVTSGYLNGWMYDSNGSGYPVLSNFGTTTTVNQTTNFYHYLGCNVVRNVTLEAISGSPFDVGLYNPNKKSVNPLHYSYTHNIANICDSSYKLMVNGSIPFVFENCYWADKHYGNYNSVPEDGIFCEACEQNPNYPDCLKNCAPCIGRDSVSVYGGSLTCADRAETLRHKVQLLNNVLVSPYLYAYHDPANYFISPDRNEDFIPDTTCASLADYDSSLYYGYHFGSWGSPTISYYLVRGEGVNETFTNEVFPVAPLTHPKIAWSIGQYTVNQTECEKKTPINGEIWSTFQSNALETVSAYYWDYPWYYHWGNWAGPYPGWFSCYGQSRMCVDSNGKMTTHWYNRGYLQFEDDCVNTYDDEYPISNTFCGPCSTNRTVIDASAITSFTPSGLIRQGTSISKDRHCYYYDNYNPNKTYKLYYEPVSGLIPIINGKAYDTDTYYVSGNYTINLTGIFVYDFISPIYYWINNNLTFGIRTSGTGSSSVFNYGCSSVQLYWPYCTGNIIPIKVVPSC